MKTRRLIFSFFALFGLLILFFMFLFSQSSVFTAARSKKQDDRMFFGITQKIEELNEGINKIGNEWWTKNESVVKLMAAALKNLVTEEGYIGPEVFDDGCVVRVANGEVIYPEGFTGYIEDLSAKIIESDPQNFPCTYHNDAADVAGRVVFINIKPLTGDYYYIDWTTYDEYIRDTSIFYTLADDALTSMEKSYGSFFLVVSNTDNAVLYCSDSLCASGNNLTLDDLNISRGSNYIL